MYNNAYEDYIRSVLGYPNNNQNSYNDYMQNDYEENRSSELEECYPEIYKIVYPMVKKACQNVVGTITKDDIDRMVDELYSNIEGNDQINVNVNLSNNIQNLNSVQVENRDDIQQNKRNIIKQETRYFNGKKVIEEPKRPEKFANNRRVQESNLKNTVENIQQENRGFDGEARETRQFNRGLSDIIRILLLRELLGRPGGPCGPGRPCNRPPFPPQGRPPFPPPNRPGRPPFNREWDDGLYEY